MTQDKTPQQLRKFGLTVGLALVVLAGARWYFSHGRVLPYIAGLGALLIAIGLVAPRLLRPIEKGWMTLALVLAWINTRIILTVLFVLVFTPIGLIVRLFNDPLQRRLHDGSASYWIRRQPKTGDAKGYERQF